MSVAEEKPTSTTEAACADCGAPVADDQEWCLECGTARTVVHDAPEWRVPVAIVGGVVALVAAGAVLALVAASRDVNRTATFQPAKASVAASSSAVSAPPAAPRATTAPAPTPTTPTTATPAPAPSTSNHAAAAAPGAAAA